MSTPRQPHTPPSPSDPSAPSDVSDVPDASSDADAEWDLDREWAEARVRAGHAPYAYDPSGETPSPIAAIVSPFLLLYSGFFMGPWATFAVALLALSQRPTLRFVAFAASLCAAIWLLIQGVTMWLIEGWTLAQIQALRSAINFVLGVVMLFVVRGWTRGRLVHTRQTLTNTAALAALLIATYIGWRTSVVPTWLGR